MDILETGKRKTGRKRQNNFVLFAFFIKNVPFHRHTKKAVQQLSCTALFKIKR